MELDKSSMENKKVAIVTGSSTGIGYETSILLSRNGFKTYATMRNLKKSQPIIDIANKEGLSLVTKQLDVDNENSVNEAISSIIEENGRVDLLVNNAGYGIMGAVEEISMDELKSQFETNFFGTIRVTKTILPIMRKQGKGTIVNVSSVGGRIGIPFFSAYISSKFALEGLSESMRYELEPFGINVILIEPGVVKTNFFENSNIAKNAKSETSPYSKLMQKVFEGFEPMLKNGFSLPSDVANTINEAIKSDNQKIRYVVGKDGDSLINTRQRLSDKEFEDWMKESFFQQKGFIR